MDAIERLKSIEEIKKLKARYCRAVDTKGSDLFRSLFTEDTVVDFRGAATDASTGTNYVPNVTTEALYGIDNVVFIGMKNLFT